MTFYYDLGYFLRSTSKQEILTNVQINNRQNIHGGETPNPTLGAVGFCDQQTKHLLVREGWLLPSEPESVRHWTHTHTVTQGFWSEKGWASATKTLIFFLLFRKDNLSLPLSKWFLDILHMVFTSCRAIAIAMISNANKGVSPWAH